MVFKGLEIRQEADAVPPTSGGLMLGLQRQGGSLEQQA